MTIHLGYTSPHTSSDQPEQRCENHHNAAPIWSCFRRGLHCRICYQTRGALLPHLFTLTLRRRRYTLCCTSRQDLKVPPRRYLASFFR